MSNIYTDRFGKTHILSADSKRRARSGVFGIARAHNRYLVLWAEEEPDTPEVPGGGIDAGEDPVTALCREFYEETGVTIDKVHIPPAPFLERTLQYYATCDDEFLDYHQRYYFIDNAEHIYFEGKRKTPENGTAAWLTLEELAQETMHASHRSALDALLEKIGGR